MPIIFKSLKYLQLLLIIMCSTFLVSSVQATLYEDAEQYGVQNNIQKPNRTADGWYVYDYTPAGAVVHSVYDAIKQSHVIQFVGQAGTNANGYVIGDWYPTSPGSWNNNAEFNVSWCHRYAGPFVVFMRVFVANSVTYTHPRTGSVITTKQRYLTYTASAVDGGINTNYPNYLNLGLGNSTQNGQWHSIQRNMLADLQQYEPGNTITSVTAFLIRGNGKIDDIELTALPLNPALNLKKTTKTIHDPVNGLTNPKAIPGATVEYTITAENISNGSADSGSTVIKDKVPAKMKLCVSTIAQCISPNINTANNSSGLSLAGVQYSNNNGTSYVYNPVADAGGYDSAVTHVKYQFNDKFLGSCGVDRSVELKMRMGVK